MPGPWVVPLIAGAASLVGQFFQNKSNKAEARRSERFSEEMSNTAVQRSAEDYKRAGLNPGLAYDRSASSPMGVQAQIGNLIEPAEASAYNAMNYRQRRIDQDLSREMTRASMGAAHAANARDTAASNLSAEQLIQTRLQTQLQQQLQPSIIRQAAGDAAAAEFEAALKGLLIPGARNAAGFDEMIGKLGPALKFGTGVIGAGASAAGNIARIIQGFSKKKVSSGRSFSPTSSPPRPRDTSKLSGYGMWNNFGTQKSSADRK